MFYDQTIIFCIIFCRQVAPLKDNHAANSLAEVIQLRNIRKVAVNARITAVLWLLEFAANFSVVLIWIVINGSSSHGGLTNSMSWFYVILPFTHLMNTSYNKDRIIDDSWKSVILNAVKSLFWFISKRTTSEVEKNNSKEGTSNDERIPIENKQAKESHLQESDVSIISIDNKKIETNMNPCTSNGKHSTTDANKVRSSVCTQSSTDSESDGHKNTPAKSQRLKKGESLLSGMWHNINDEEAYTHYFKQLLELEYPSSKTTDDHFDAFNIVIYHKSFLTTKTWKPKRSKINHKNYETSSSKSGKNFKNGWIDETPLCAKFAIDLEERVKMRESRLEGFLVNCDDESAYEAFINTLISFEEELLKQ